MIRQFILDSNDNPVPCDNLMVWGIWMETAANRKIALDTIGEVKISTVFLGLDHNYSGIGEPILFETMIFGGPHDQYQDRYTTKEEALIGHQKALDLVRAGE